MSSPQKGFDPHTALQLRSRAGDQNRWTGIIAAVEEITEVLGADGLLEEQGQHAKSAWEQLLTPAKFSRQVTLPSNQLVNVQALTSMNELYHSEQQFLTEAHRFTLAQIFKEEETSLTDTCTADEGGEGASWIEPLTDGEHLLLLRAVEYQIRRDIDDVSRLNGYATFTAGLSQNDLVPIHGQALLSDFFKVCEHPNEAEVLMLTEACDQEDVAHTERCFQEKRGNAESVTRARTLLQGRKRRRERELARRLQETMQKVVL
ncbi:hypothetical protein LTR65_007131 [Meristemomyces frigidus]